MHKVCFEYLWTNILLFAVLFLVIGQKQRSIRIMMLFIFPITEHPEVFYCSYITAICQRLQFWIY